MKMKYVIEPFPQLNDSPPARWQWVQGNFRVINDQLFFGLEEDDYPGDASFTPHPENWMPPAGSVVAVNPAWITGLTLLHLLKMYRVKYIIKGEIMDVVPVRPPKPVRKLKDGSKIVHKEF